MIYIYNKKAPLSFFFSAEPFLLSYTRVHQYECIWIIIYITYSTLFILIDKNVYNTNEVSKKIGRISLDTSSRIIEDYEFILHIIYYILLYITSSF